MEINYLLNALHYLSGVANQKTAIELFNELALPVTKQNEKFGQDMHSIIVVEEKISEIVNIDSEQLNYYFLDNGLRDSSIAMLLFLHTAIYNRFSVDEAVERLLHCDDKYVWDSIASRISMRNESNEYPQNYEDFLNAIANDSIKPEITIRAINSFTRRKEYIVIIGDMLKEVESALKSLNSIIMPIFEAAAIRYRDVNFISEFQESKLFDISNFEQIEVNISLFFNASLLIEFRTEPIHHLVIVIGVFSWDMVTLRRTNAVEKISTEEIAKIISDKTRLDIISYLRDKTSYGQELSRVFGLSRNTIYKHMSKLWQAKLVQCKYTTKNIYYSINVDVIQSFIEQFSLMLIGKMPHWD